MHSGILKYDLLDPLQQNEVNDFIDFLLSKKDKKPSLTEYKKKILAVSTWSDEDLQVFETM
jgi:hypothetical protein